jgi:hypothetical protein
MPMPVHTISVGWEYEVPLEEIQSARQSLRTELEAYFHSDPESLTDAEVARFVVRSSHPTGRYLRPHITGLGY